jgi:hypothetical protein
MKLFLFLLALSNTAQAADKPYIIIDDNNGTTLIKFNLPLIVQVSNDISLGVSVERQKTINDPYFQHDQIGTTAIASFNLKF